MDPRTKWALIATAAVFPIMAFMVVDANADHAPHRITAAINGLLLMTIAAGIAALARQTRMDDPMPQPLRAVAGALCAIPVMFVLFWLLGGFHGYPAVTPYALGFLIAGAGATAGWYLQRAPEQAKAVINTAGFTLLMLAVCGGAGMLAGFTVIGVLGMSDFGALLPPLLGLAGGALVGALTATGAMVRPGVRRMWPLTALLAYVAMTALGLVLFV